MALPQARGGFLCLLSGSPIDYKYIRVEGTAGRMGQKLMAVVAEGIRGRVYLAPTAEMESVGAKAHSEWKPETKPANAVWFANYGLDTYGDLFTHRQLVVLTTFSDLVQEARNKVKADAMLAGLTDDDQGLDEGGTGATAYADAVAVYLAFAVERRKSLVKYLSWHSGRDTFRAPLAVKPSQWYGI